MCGLFGWKLFKELSVADMRVFSSFVAVQNDIRGGHSWGVINSDRTVVKDLGRISNSTTIRRIGLENTLLGHTRYGTTGKQTVENAHPFYIKGKIGVLGMHNGVLSNHETLNKKYERNHEVDSQHIFSHIDEGLPLTEIEGYGAITYLRDDSNYIFLGKFNSGVLSVVRLFDSQESFQNKMHSGIAWSSDLDHLTKSLQIAGIVYQGVTVDENTLYSIREDDIYVDNTLIVGKRWKSFTNDSYSNRYASYLGSEYKQLPPVKNHAKDCPCTICWEKNLGKKDSYHGKSIISPQSPERFYSTSYILKDKKDASECFDFYKRKRVRLSLLMTEYDLNVSLEKKEKIDKSVEQIEALSYTLNRGWKLLNDDQRKELWSADVEEESMYL